MDGVDVISRSLTVFDLPYLQLTELSVSVAVTLDCRLFVYQEKNREGGIKKKFVLEITAVEESWFDSGSVHNAARFGIVASLSLWWGKKKNPNHKAH